MEPTKKKLRIREGEKIYLIIADLTSLSLCSMAWNSFVKWNEISVFNKTDVMGVANPTVGPFSITPTLKWITTIFLKK